MSRRKQDFTRTILPDAVYQSLDIAKFINKLMQDGKKLKAERIFYKALEAVAKRTETEPKAAFNTALSNIMPVMEVRSRRVGGSTYQVPVPVEDKRAKALAMRWIIAAADAKSGDMVSCLSNELTDAFNKTGVSYKKKEDMHRMADANKAFSHFRW